MSGNRKNAHARVARLCAQICRSPAALNRRALIVVLVLLGSVWAAWLAAAPPEVLGAGSPAYPLKLSANERYLVDQNNTPFLITGDNPHALLGMGSTADAEFYFADRQTHGFNAVWMNLLVATPAYYDSRAVAV